MALGATGIAAVRSKISEINTKAKKIQTTNANFLNLYKDDNFQKFVRETAKGEVISQQLIQLSKLITQVESTVQKMTARTETFLRNQENLNRM